MILTCGKCKKTEVFFTFADGSLPNCEECCPDHDYEYDPDRRDRFCKHCDALVPADWYDHS